MTETCCLKCTKDSCDMDVVCEPNKTLWNCNNGERIKECFGSCYNFEEVAVKVELKTR